jgi:hypothetical protein
MAASRDTEYARADTGNLYVNAHEAAQIQNTGRILVDCAGLIDSVNTPLMGQEREYPRPESD